MTRLDGDPELEMKSSTIGPKQRAQDSWVSY